MTVTAQGDADAVDEAATITNAASGGGYNGVSGFVRVGVADDEPSAGTDYDADNDGLIDVDSLAQLNAMRWDLDGDGAPSSGNAANYAAAFTSAAAGMGCPDGPDANQLADACGGYALTADLDFDTSGDGKVDADDEFASWTPIVGWDTMLDGRGHAISNLTVTGAGNDRGLFATATTNATVRALGLADVSVTGTGVRLGALAGVFNGRVAAVYATGVVRGAGGVAGLVAETQSTSARIVASYSLVAVECTSSQNWARAGGLAARNDGTITTSYAAGAITGDCPATVKGGLASVNNGTVTASYWDADQTGIADDTDNPPQSPEGLSSSAMWTPTAYGASASDVYNVWDEQDVDGDGAVDEDPWDFGGALNHPVLKWGGLDPADQRTNYDADGDRLIDIATLGQLNAVRWDLDGDGAPSSGNESSYWGTGAFFNGVFNPSGVGLLPDDDGRRGRQRLPGLRAGRRLGLRHRRRRQHLDGARRHGDGRHRRRVRQRRRRLDVHRLDGGECRGQLRGDLRRQRPRHSKPVHQPQHVAVPRAVRGHHREREHHLAGPAERPHSSRAKPDRRARRGESRSHRGGLDERHGAGGQRSGRPGGFDGHRDRARRRQLQHGGGGMHVERQQRRGRRSGGLPRRRLDRGELLDRDGDRGVSGRQQGGVCPCGRRHGGGELLGHDPDRRRGRHGEPAAAAGREDDGGAAGADGPTTRWSAARPSTPIGTTRTWMATARPATTTMPTRGTSASRTSIRF